MRELTSHKVNGLNKTIGIQVLDEPGKGGANHKYLITIPVPPEDLPNTLVDRGGYPIHFQNGSPEEVGINGISNEALLAIVEDRLIGFESGPFATTEVSLARAAIQTAMMCLQNRTRERIARGVEGKLKK